MSVVANSKSWVDKGRSRLRHQMQRVVRPVVRRLAARSRGSRLWLPAIIRHADLEHIRRSIDNLVDGAHVDPTDGSLPADVRLARAVLLGAYGSVAATQAITVATRDASRHTVRAATARLLSEQRADAAWLVAESRPDVRPTVPQLLTMARGIVDDDLLDRLIAYVEAPSTRMTATSRRHVDMSALVNRGRHAFSLGDLDVALERFQTAEDRMQTAWTATWIARATLELGRLELAHEFATRALERQLGYRPAVVVQAAVNLARGDVLAARRGWGFIVSDVGATLEELRTVWAGMHQAGLHEEAAAAAERMFAKSGASPVAKACRATSLWHLGRREDADAQVMDLREQFEATSIRALAFYLGHTGRSTEAYEALSALTMVVRGPHAMRELIQGLVRDGHLRTAHLAAQRAISSFPDDRRLAPYGKTTV